MIIRSTGLPQVTVLPTDAPTDNGPRFVQFEDSNTFGYWDGAAWNQVTISDDAGVVHDTGNETIAGIKTFTSDPLIPDEAYGIAWNGSLEPPTKNAIYDKIETLAGIAPSKIYKAIIAQSGTGLPTATILLNTLGEVPTFVRNNIGDYELNTVAGIFLTNKTLVHATISTGSTAAIIRAGIGVAVTEVAFKTFDAADVAADLVGTLNLTIEVFP